jgi:hypothetical protein
MHISVMPHLYSSIAAFFRCATDSISRHESPSHHSFAVLWDVPAGDRRAINFNTEKLNVKVKLSLCLTKHHVMKMYWWSGDIVPRIL